LAKKHQKTFQWALFRNSFIDLYIATCYL